MATFTINSDSSYEEISVGVDNINGPNACTDFAGSPAIVYLPSGETFDIATAIYANENGDLHLPGFYSDGSIWREWDGSAFVSSGLC